MFLLDKDIWEFASFVVTVLGFPFAIALFFYEQRKERDNEEEEIHQLLSDSYVDFLKLVLQNPDLKLITEEHTENLSEEQKERMVVLFNILVSLFERAYLLTHKDSMNEYQQKRWNSWEDSMKEWVSRKDFKNNLPILLNGEDPDFVRYINSLKK